MKIRDKGEEFLVFLIRDHLLHHGEIIADVKRSRGLYP